MMKEIDAGGRHFELYTFRGNGDSPGDSGSPAARQQRPNPPPVELLSGWPVSVPSEISIPVRSKGDILVACQRGEKLATQWGFQAEDRSLVTNVMSELARNILRCSQKGEAVLRVPAAGENWVVVVAAFA